MPVDPIRVLVFGAHPDDAEVYAGGLLVRHCRLGAMVRIVSVTDGRSGHFCTPPEELVVRRRAEARRAGELIGADYRTWDFPDGSLQPDLSVRSAIIQEMRSFQPDLVLTHRPNDYHPDHRSVGQAVQDASYMVTVPYVCPEQPALRRDPVVAYMCDMFTRPNVLRADVVLDIQAEFDALTEMAACHESQFFEWLPYHDGKLAEVPQSPRDRLEMFRAWMRELMQRRCQHFQQAVQKLANEGHRPNLIEVFEVSEYAAQLDHHSRPRLFPGHLPCETKM